MKAAVLFARAEREHTPIDLALWLVELVERVKV
jgi:hypothetical protein